MDNIKRRLAQGYRAVGLEPIAKTLSDSFRMAARRRLRRARLCLCATSTVNPFLAQWNKQFAAHKFSFPRNDVAS